MASKDNALKTASVLAFERKLDPSDALFFQGSWGQRDKSTEWEPIHLREKAVRGTMSHRTRAGSTDAAKLDRPLDVPNPQIVDVATLSANCDTLKVSFTLRVLGGTGMPSACNNADYQAKLLSTVQGYVESNGFGELGRRYAHNLANGRFLWRNRIGAEQVEIRIRHLEKGEAKGGWVFDALQLSLRNFQAPDGIEKDIRSLADVITTGLAGKGHVLLQVTAFARIGAGQEVYPSQELILDKTNSKKSKTLYDVQGIAGIHSQKLGNALRTIDTWHSDANSLGPIAVEPYGSVTTLGKACRKPTDKLDFYNLLDGWLLKDKVPPLEQQHFVMAILIRGGVFGEADKD